MSEGKEITIKKNLWVLGCPHALFFWSDVTGGTGGASVIAATLAGTEEVIEKMIAAEDEGLNDA